MNVFKYLVAVFVLVSCERREAVQIDVIVRNNFEGDIIIKEGKQGEFVRQKNGRFQFEVPESGTLVVTSVKPFRDWYSLEVKFANGEVILPVVVAEKERGVSYYKNVGGNSDGDILLQVEKLP